MLKDKVLALAKSLHQRPRSRLVPLPDYAFLDQLLHAAQRAERGTGVDRPDPARMTGAPCFEQIECFGPAHFADGDAIGPQAQCGTDKI